MLKAANDACATDIGTAKAAYKNLAEERNAREAAANQAMAAAEPIAETHTENARKIQAKPPVKREGQCDAIESEQIQYVKTRNH
jgi:hypothetical protein